jgi:hypothetical protein
MATYGTVDEYIAAQSEQAQARLREMRAVIRAAVPQAAEVISYGMPTYRLGRATVHFGAARRHCALYGAATDACADELQHYETGPPPDRPRPASLGAGSSGDQSGAQATHTSEARRDLGLDRLEPQLPVAAGGQVPGGGAGDAHAALFELAFGPGAALEAFGDLGRGGAAIGPRNLDNAV